MDQWSIIIAARRSLLETFEELDDDEWRIRSLSEGWTIRQLLAHLILAARPPARRYVAAIARARGNFDRANHALAVADAQQPLDELLSGYRAVVEHRFSPPGWPSAAPLSDILIHSLDVRIPLGLGASQPSEAYESVIEFLISRAGRVFSPKSRPDVRWVATDVDWSAGEGPDVYGAIADLALTAAGRAARIGRLTGDGVPQLQGWLAS